MGKKASKLDNWKRLEGAATVAALVVLITCAIRQ